MANKLCCILDPDVSCEGCNKVWCTVCSNTFVQERTHWSYAGENIEGKKWSCSKYDYPLWVVVNKDASVTLSRTRQFY